jgi:hypothetical protein
MQSAWPLHCSQDAQPYLPYEPCSTAPSIVAITPLASDAEQTAGADMRAIAAVRVMMAAHELFNAFSF